ncbi:MAG: HlyD family efflux transporter periplasmic adaptor subunit [Verrucomicrobia bacterium]|jgi:multidrug resistance efflux pump|nr:HlyD family efflux transporter periplasmic adaptor subunit [Verrucomicrobiota bacterium]
MPKLEPIPTPLALHWREFRVKVLPLLTFVAAVVVCAAIWTHHVSPASLLGQAVSAQASISSSRPGLLAMVKGDIDQPVRAGEVIATVLTSPPRLLEASLAVIQAEAELIRLGMSPLADADRNELNLERLKLDLLQQRTALALARVQLNYAESEYRRLSALRLDPAGIASDSDYEIARRDRDLARTEVEQLEVTVANVAETLRRFERGLPISTPENRELATRKAIEAQQRQLEVIEAQLGPEEVLSPIDGVITSVLRRAGENVTAGEPILTILSTNISGIVAYLPLNSPLPVAAGMDAEVRRRTSDRATGLGQVTRVSAYYAPIPPLLQWSPTLNRQTNTIGLPLWVSVPSGMTLIPGEVVGIRLLPAN